MPLLWLSVAFLAGILLASLLHLSTLTWLILAVLALLLALIRPRLSRFTHTFTLLTLPSLPIPYPLLFLALLLGATRYQSAQPEFSPGFLAWYNDSPEKTEVEGILTKMPDVRDLSTILVVQVDQMRSQGAQAFTPAKGLLLARVLNGKEWHYGDRASFEGMLETPPESDDFSYRGYLARRGIYSYMAFPASRLLEGGQGDPFMSGMYAIKERALEMVYRLYPDPEASLLAGVLLGVESGIPRDVADAFKNTGTSHIIVISGFNMAIVAALFMAVFGRLLGRWRGALVAVIGILLYVLLVGAEPSVVRAAIMGGLSIFAVQLGRRQEGVNSLAIAAAVMCLLYPMALWEVGFQLSFAATLGLVLYAGPFTAAFTRFATRYLSLTTVQRVAGPVGEYGLFTLAAQLLILPIILYHFHRLSLVSVIANPVILPAQPPMMILGGLAALLGMLYQPLGQLAAYLALPFALFTIRAVELFAQIPSGVLSFGSLSLLVVLLLYGLIFGVTFAAPNLKKAASSLKPSLVMLVLGSLTVLIWRAALSAPDGRLTMTLLDVGGGDALLIQTPTGRNLLVDGGLSTTRLSDALGRRLPVSNRRLDWLVVAGSRKEQLTALPGVIERFPPENVLWAGPAGGSRAAGTLQEALLEARVPVTVAEAGQILDLGQGARLRVLTAGERGAALLLEWGDFRLVLPLGMEASDLETLEYGRQIGRVSALLLADNGGKSLNPPEWIANLRPQVVLLSAFTEDPKSLPSSETLQAIQGYSILRTDRNGWIRLSTDGKQMWVEAEK